MIQDWTLQTSNGITQFLFLIIKMPAYTWMVLCCIMRPLMTWVTLPHKKLLQELGQHLMVGLMELLMK